MTAGPPFSAPPRVVKTPAGPARRLATLVAPAAGALRALRTRIAQQLALPPALQAGNGAHRIRSMQWWHRPRSLSGLMLLGLAFIAVPLLWAIITAAFQMSTLTTTGQQLVRHGATSARAGQALSSQLVSLERDARVYDGINRDPALLAVYHKQSTQLAATREQLNASASVPVKQTLEQFRQAQQTIDRLVATIAASDPATRHADELDTSFTRIWGLVDHITQQTNDQTDGALLALQAQADHARVRLFLEAGLLLPLTGVAIFGLTIVIGRPLRHLDRVISDLGEKKNLSKPIEVPGPYDLERLGRRLEWLRMRMLELENERSRFMREMSHELKTPLAAIADGTELLMDGTVGTLDPAQQEVMEILREKSKSLQEMIDNLLSFTAWQTSSVGLLPGEFGLRSLIKQVIENHRIMILRQRIRLDLRIDDITMLADRSKFRLIVENLVSNALKYSPKAGTIHMKARQEGSQLVLEVADHGPGIPVDERDHIFDPFFTGRAAKVRKSSQKGTGIGLSVVLEFVSAHQGRIEIIDGEYPGAHFRVTMPLRLEGDDVPGSESPRAHAA